MILIAGIGAAIDSSIVIHKNFSIVHARTIKKA